VVFGKFFGGRLVSFFAVLFDGLLLVFWSAFGGVWCALVGCLVSF
jgi:hypothetical protein